MNIGLSQHGYAALANSERIFKSSVKKMSNTLTNEAHQRSLKDFLTLYNTISEYCFSRCISTFNERFATQTETSCVDVCTSNYVQYNQMFMFKFVDHQEQRKQNLPNSVIQEGGNET
ncbi:mitochondrial import inner membrane translocase subunit Tim9-like isoform X2 [Biomphalaria glabrata]|uniref:Mitochondrial import inner membrane translocase subunit n=1 Tax=Biomphalaria glabrata TaxID=6526 RepID=A0A9W3B6M2_BIOGL|nr:mitochondrial import inner membrane translocase subunit Tim9-like isoform X2 [Biomphalaria glabrata]